MAFGTTTEVYTDWSPRSGNCSDPAVAAQSLPGKGPPAVGSSTGVSASERPGGDTDQLRLHGADPNERSGGLHHGVALLRIGPREPMQQGMSRSAQPRRDTVSGNGRTDHSDEGGRSWSGALTIPLTSDRTGTVPQEAARGMEPRGGGGHDSARVGPTMMCHTRKIC